MSAPLIRSIVLATLTMVVVAPVDGSSDGFSAVIGEGPAGGDSGQLLGCTGTLPAPGAVLCVRAGAPGGGSGTASAPYNSIMGAIGAAKAGDIVQVAAGTYRENVALGIRGAPTSGHLILLGGFNANFATRDALAHRSVIDGGGADPGIQLHLQGSGTTVVDGFVITGGVGLGTSFNDGGGHGGGVFASMAGSGTIVISHNHIHDNHTRGYSSIDSRGGGAHAEVDASAGPGSIRIEDNHVRDNRAAKGAGINVNGRDATVQRNLIVGNIAHGDHGGGIYVSTDATLIRGNEVRGNVVGATVGYGWGGGIIIAGANAAMERNLIVDNGAPSGGAGVFWDEAARGTMRNDLITRNRCPTGNGGAAALYVDGGPVGPSRVTLYNVTIAGHDCPQTPDGAAVVVEAASSLAVRNSILWGNTREFLSLTGGSIEVTYSISSRAGAGNRARDPLFVDAAAGDYHVRSMGGRYTRGGWVLDPTSSPAIDAGDPAADAALESSPNGGRLNLGVFGNTIEASRSLDSAVFILVDGFE